jgi:glucose-6-phosphate 1-dehydrogenase
MNDATFIIFGATGDLAKRKLIPALYQLVAKKKLNNFAIIGVAKSSSDVHELLESARPFIERLDESMWAQLQARFFYSRLDVACAADYAHLKLIVEGVEKQFGLSGNRLIYCALAANLYCEATHQIAESGLAVRKDVKDFVWHRLVYEKPFGHDLKSAHEINACIARYFYETQIYRIDHYLTKEVVSNITLIRFTNLVFEPLWNNRYIDQVQIILSEQNGIEGRGGYYDYYGALRDVVQNHMLELLALIAMEAPEKISGDYVRAQRAKVLDTIEVVDGMLGQYEGYKNEEHVRPDSSTETFAALMLRVRNQRWAGVPFYLLTGKKMAGKETVIHLKFKQVDCLLKHGCPMESNWLTIRVWPEGTFTLTLNAKKPGFSDELVPITMDFCHSCIFGISASEAYETLLEDIMRGEQATAVRFDEIEYAWRVIDTVRDRKFPLYSYKPESSGPQEINEFERKHGMRWRI